MSGTAASPSEVLAHVVINAVSVPVTAEGHISRSQAERAIQCVPFRDWVAGMDKDLHVESVKLQSIDFFGDRVGFVKFVAKATFHGKPIPGIVFMRGGAVGVLVVLVCEEQRWALCVRQPRLPAGKADFLEIPAGMLDGSGHFSGVAAKELSEETGIDIADDELVDMTELVYGPSSSIRPELKKRSSSHSLAVDVDGVGAGAAASGSAAAPASGEMEAEHRGMYPSVGGCDEFLRLMYYCQEVEPEFLRSLQGKVTGCIAEDEQITLDLVPLDQLWEKAPDGKTLAAVLLYEKLRARGALK